MRKYVRLSEPADLERRIAAGPGAALTVTPSKGKRSIGTLVGHAAVFNSLSEDLGGFRERIKPGAFRSCLASKPDVRALVDHESGRILGRTRAGTLRLAEDEAGLRFEIDVPAVYYGEQIIESVRRGDITQCSFAFTLQPPAAQSETWTRDGDGLPIRELLALRLHDVSIVTFPAYPATDVSAMTDDDRRRARIAALERVVAADRAADDRWRRLRIRIADAIAKAT